MYFLKIELYFAILPPFFIQYRTAAGLFTQELLFSQLKSGSSHIFLGFCSNCFTYFIVNNDNVHNDCSNCDFCYDRYDCHDCSYCITNVIDYSKEIINVLHTSNDNDNDNDNNNNNDNKKMLATLILKLNDEYGNLNTTF